MSDFFSNIPGWARGTIAILFFVSGTNVAQYFGLSAPAKRDFAAVESRESWCDKQLDKKDLLLVEKDKLLQECWKERAKECGR